MLGAWYLVNGDNMKIKKILNNNAVITLNEYGHDIVITGLGIAYQKKIGEEIENLKIERIFKVDSMENEGYNRIKELLNEIPKEYIEVSEAVLTYASNIFKKKLSENTIITLADHIYFAVGRVNMGLNIKNPLIWEVKRYYEDEYKVGIHSLDIIEKKLGLRLPEDEAASIALHLVNAKIGEDVPEIISTINILQDALNIIKYHFFVEFEDEVLSFQRLVTHLKFFAQRILRGEGLVDSDNVLYDMVKVRYPESFDCACKIGNYAKEEYSFNVSPSELTFLTVHIERVIKNTDG